MCCCKNEEFYMKYKAKPCGQISGCGTNGYERKKLTFSTKKFNI